MKLSDLRMVGDVKRILFEYYVISGKHFNLINKEEGVLIRVERLKHREMETIT